MRYTYEGWMALLQVRALHFTWRTSQRAQLLQKGTWYQLIPGASEATHTFCCLSEHKQQLLAPSCTRP